VEYIPDEVIDQPIHWIHKRGVLEDRLRYVSHWSTGYDLKECSLREEHTPLIVLYDKIDSESLQHLLSLRLGSRCVNSLWKWESQKREDASLREKKRKDQRSMALAQMNADMKAIGEALPFWLVKRTAEIYTCVNIEYC
jgi:hypothetical protein